MTRISPGYHINSGCSEFSECAQSGEVQEFQRPRHDNFLVNSSFAAPFEFVPNPPPTTKSPVVVHCFPQISISLSFDPMDSTPQKAPAIGARVSNFHRLPKERF
jgi:hypothetical protein